MNPDIGLPKLSILDSEMAYREAGRTDAPVALFVHGNPTSSYIWHNIIPIVAGAAAHCIAPDLIGFGQSGKPSIGYREFARKLHDCRLVKLGSGVHFLQEDHPETIGRPVAAFIAEIEDRGA
jgi:haloalkane dehalogenase